MAALINLPRYTLTNSDLVDLEYTEVDLTFKITKLSRESFMSRNVFTDENNVVIMKLANTNSKYWLMDLTYKSNELLYSMLKNPRYHSTNPFNLIVDIYDARVSSNIITLTDKNINEAYEYIQYSGETPLASLPYSIIIDFIPITLPKIDQPLFNDSVAIDGAAPYGFLSFIDDSTTEWKVGLDSNKNLLFRRAGYDDVLSLNRNDGTISSSKNLSVPRVILNGSSALLQFANNNFPHWTFNSPASTNDLNLLMGQSSEQIISINRSTGAITFTKALNINNPSPALILTGSNSISGGMQSNIAGEVAVVSFTNHNLSFFTNGNNSNVYKIASFKTNKTIDFNGNISVNKTTTGGPIFSTDDTSSSTSVWGEFYKKNPSRVAAVCNTFTFNIPTNIPTIIPFNTILNQQGNKVVLNTTTGLFTLSEIGMYQIDFTWAPHDVVNTRMNASYIIRNPAGATFGGPVIISNNGDSCQLSTTIYISSVPSTIEFRAMHYLGSNLRLATSTSVGDYWTYASVMYIY